MRKLTLSLSLILLVAAAPRAQDSSRIDIGWLTLDRGLTQTIHIKGEDLEKMPFLNLSDAIAAWLFGAYTRPGMLAYVVDGNPVTDVNLYSIYDIEEVTLVESAVAAAGYGATQQQLVVITTRKGKGRGGSRMAVQGGPVTQNGNGVHTSSNLYYQYYWGAYANMGKISFGVSADGVRDVVPQTIGTNAHLVTPNSLFRSRFNGYFTWRPNPENTIELRMGYASQQGSYRLDSTNGSHTIRQSLSTLTSDLLIPQLDWRLKLATGLQNQLAAEYIGSSANSASLLWDSTDFLAPVIGDTAVAKASHLVVRDRISGDWKAGNWRVGPSLNVFYDHIDEKTARAATYFTYVNNNVVIVNPPLGPLQEKTGNLLFFTPAVDIGLARVLDLQVGAQLNASPGRDPGSKPVMPFASLGLELLHVKKSTGAASLKVFGSYAQRSTAFLDDFSMPDYSGGGMPYSLADVDRGRKVPESWLGGGPPPDSFLVRTAYRRTFWTGEAGIAYVTANGRLQLQYTFEKREYLTNGEFGSMGATADSSSILLISNKSTLHHFDLRWKAMEAKGLHWLMDFNVTLLTNKQDKFTFPPGFTFGYIDYSVGATNINGDLPTSKMSWTGGLVNRWQVGDFTAGLDLQYHFGETVYPAIYVGPLNTGEKLNSVMTPNIYLGYQWKLGPGSLQLFLESRGLARSQSSDLLDNRRYYTIGGTFAF